MHYETQFVLSMLFNDAVNFWYYILSVRNEYGTSVERYWLGEKAVLGEELVQRHSAHHQWYVQRSRIETLRSRWQATKFVFVVYLTTLLAAQDSFQWQERNKM